MVRNHNKVVMSGTLGTAEVWSVGFALRGTLESDIVINPETLSDLSRILLETFADPGSYPGLKFLMSTDCVLRECTMYAYDASGPAVAVGSSDGANIAGSGTATKPYQTACVISLRTALAGASRRGRLYWPALGASISGNRLQSPTDEATVAGNWRDFMEDVITNWGLTALGLRPVVVSETLATVTPVTNVLVGDVLDTQRRRRDEMPEVYSSVPYPAP